MLADKRILISGVVTTRSIAFAVAEQAQRAGAEVLLTSFGRARTLTERAARLLPAPTEVLQLDVNASEDLAALAETVRARWGGLDGFLHAIAFAPPDALGGNFLRTPPESAITAFRTSAYSLKACAETLAPLLAEGSDGAGIVALDFDDPVAWPLYDWMGVSKAALRAVARYLARDLGAGAIRVNLVSSGPLETVAAGALPHFDALVDLWSAQAPLGWDYRDGSPVAAAVCFLLSDWARAITGEILHVDGGVHALSGLQPAPTKGESR